MSARRASLSSIQKSKAVATKQSWCLVFKLSINVDNFWQGGYGNETDKQAQRN
jgi:hypothetical protein